jgi:hypothetical protein
MEEKDQLESRSKAVTNATSPDDASQKEDDFELRLDALPEKYRTEILRQYDLPEVKVTLLTTFQYATWIEVLLMLVGSLAAAAAGISPSSIDIRRGASPDDSGFWKYN